MLGVDVVRMRRGRFGGRVCLLIREGVGDVVRGAGVEGGRSRWASWLRVTDVVGKGVGGCERVSAGSGGGERSSGVGRADTI